MNYPIWIFINSQTRPAHLCLYFQFLGYDHNAQSDDLHLNGVHNALYIHIIVSHHGGGVFFDYSIQNHALIYAFNPDANFIQDCGVGIQFGVFDDDVQGDICL